MENNNEIQRGDLWYIPAKNLGIEGEVLQWYKVQIYKVFEDNDVLVEVKHYKTKKCNKVHIMLEKSTLELYGYKID